MRLRTRMRVEYTLAPWHLRLRWWMAEVLWGWGKSFEDMGAQSADQANPWWRC